MRDQGLLFEELQIASPEFQVVINAREITPSASLPDFEFARQMIELMNGAGSMRVSMKGRIAVDPRTILGSLRKPYAISVQTAEETTIDWTWEVYHIKLVQSLVLVLVSYQDAHYEEHRETIAELLSHLRQDRTSPSSADEQLPPDHG